MYCIRDRMSRRLLTSTTDGRRAQLLVAGFEQLTISRDIGAGNHYWYLGRLRLGEVHPYDVGAQEHLQDELAGLIRAHRAGQLAWA